MILDVVYYGQGKIATTPIGPNLPKWSAPETPVYDYDPAEAEALLDAAGFPPGADGVRFKLVHDPLPYGDSPKRTGEYIQQALKAVGIDVELRSQDFATYIKRVYTDRDFDFTNNLMGNTFDPTLGVQRLYWSKNFKKGVPFSNGSGWNNPEADAALEAAAVETDEVKRRAQFARFQELVYEEVPSITLLNYDQITIFNKRCATIPPAPAGSTPTSPTSGSTTPPCPTEAPTDVLRQAHPQLLPLSRRPPRGGLALFPS